MLVERKTDYIIMCTFFNIKIYFHDSKKIIINHNHMMTILLVNIKLFPILFKKL